MSESSNTQLVGRFLVGIVIGLIVGVLIGLLIGWVLWPVEYEQAYTYQLVDDEKQQYVAAVVDSYTLTKQLDVAQQRLSSWTVEEKVSELSKLYTDYQAQGKTQEADQVVALATELQRVEGWDPQVVNQITSGVAAPTPADVPTASAPGAQAQIPGVLNLRILGLCGFLLLLGGLLVLGLVLLRQRRSREQVAAVEAEPAWTGTGPPPLLQKTSSYVLGMDNFDESFAIETEDNEWLGECGMGISEALDEGTPRRVAAFEVWLFDKPNTRTVTKVLMSDFANSNEALRNKLSSRGEPILAAPGGTFILETPALTVKAQIVEMEYGEGTPSFGYFKSLKVALTAQPRPAMDEDSDLA
jgi:hypothetical protein